jgi:hypothetical protein
MEDLTGKWCDYSQWPSHIHNRPMYVIEDDGGDWVRVEYTLSPGLPCKYVDIARVHLSPRS